MALPQPGLLLLIFIPFFSLPRELRFQQNRWKRETRGGAIPFAKTAVRLLRAINRCKQIRCTYLIDRFIGKTTML